MSTSSLRAEKLGAGYGSAKILHDVDFAVPTGAFTAIIGPNGSGKSTLLKSLARTLKPQSGQVLLQDRPIDRWKPTAVAREVAFLPQEPVVPAGITVRTLVARGRHPYHFALKQQVAGDKEAIAEAMEATAVTEFEDMGVEQLSGGQRQRVWLAMVLAQSTQIVLLDEPTSFLDIRHQIDVLELCQQMRAEGRSVVAVLHDINQAARYADHLVVMHEGNIVDAGEPATVLTSELIRKVFEVESQLLTDPHSGSPLMIMTSADQAASSEAV